MHAYMSAVKFSTQRTNGAGKPPHLSSMQTPLGNIAISLFYGGNKIGRPSRLCGLVSEMMMNNDLTLEFSSVLSMDCTRRGIHCQSKKHSLEIISKLAARQLNLSYQTLLKAILTRERMGSTGIGKGIAIPHGKLEEDALRAVGVFISLDQPIAFNAVDNQPVDLLFALLVPADQCKIHLHTLSLVAKRLVDKTVCRRLRLAQSDKELYAILIEDEDQEANT